MPKFSFVCLVNASEGRDEDFNRWHSTVHLPEVVSHGGFAKAKRLRLVSNLNDDQKSYRYLIVYEGEAPDTSKALDALNRAVADKKVTFSDTLDGDSWAAVYEEIEGASYP